MVGAQFLVHSSVSPNPQAGNEQLNYFRSWRRPRKRRVMVLCDLDMGHARNHCHSVGVLPKFVCSFFCQ